MGERIDLDSFSVDFAENFDPTEFRDQQKEIDGILSSAFDDLNYMSDNSVSENEFENKLSMKYSTGINNSSDKFSSLTSTPFRTYTNPQPKRYLHISSVVEEESDVSSISTDKSSFPVTKKTSEGEQSNDNDSKYLNEEILEENNKLSKDLSHIKDECLKMNSNYGVLHSKFEELNQVNATNSNIINKQNAKIKSLEVLLQNEKNEKDKMNKKVSILESTVESLEYQLVEIGNSDFIIKAKDVQENIILNLKKKHSLEETQLQTQIDHLQQKIEEKDKIIQSQNSVIERYQQEFSEEALNKMIEQKIRITKEILNKKHQEKMEQEMDIIKEKIQHDYLNSFDKTINQLKADWEKKLDEDIEKITNWLNQVANKETEVDNFPRVNIKLDSLLSMYEQFRTAIIKNKHEIGQHIHKLKTSQQELHEVLLESKSAQSNASTFSDSNQIEQVKSELNLARQHVNGLTEKIHKYKKAIRSLRKNNETQIDHLKEEFTSILQRINSFITNENK